MSCKRARLKGRAFFLCFPQSGLCFPQDVGGNTVVFLGMKSYKIQIVEDDIFDTVYNITANAAVQRGDAARVSTEDNKAILQEFLTEGKEVVSAALGRYGNGLDYSMPDNWDYKDEIDKRVNAFLVDYVLTSWMGLVAQVEKPVLELKQILNKRNKPI